MTPSKPLYLNAHLPERTAPLELKDIKAIIDLMKKNDLSVFEMEKDGFKLKLQKGAGDQTVFRRAAMPHAAPVPAPARRLRCALRRASRSGDTEQPR